MTDDDSRPISSLEGNAVLEMLQESQISPNKSDSKKLRAENIYMQNRELSWLAFNERVLEQGSDETVPLLERLNFVSIFASNLSEFFMVRVGSLSDLSVLKQRIVDTKSFMTPAEQLTMIYAKCKDLYPIQEAVFNKIESSLEEHSIKRRTHSTLNKEQEEYLAKYFKNNIKPYLSPQIINSRHPFPHLDNNSIYIIVRLIEEVEGIDQPKDGSTPLGVTLGIIPMPSRCERVIQLPGNGINYILLEDVIEIYSTATFSMYKIKHTNIIKLTRSADIDPTEDNEADLDEILDYREHMQRMLKKRARLSPVRLECKYKLSKTVSGFLLNKLKLTGSQVFSTCVPLNLGYTWGLPSLVARIDSELAANLTNKAFEPQWTSALKKNVPIIDQIKEKEVLLCYPYESMDPFVKLLKEAANDPKVISIKITLYRLSSSSKLAQALITAAENGKDVTALFELRARFDEHNNIEWSERFEQAGAHVIYGFHHLKVHSKLCCITRITDDGPEYITQVGTGNYNEKTAKLYTDFSFITTDKNFGYDATEFFLNMGLESTSDTYSTLWVAPIQIKRNILSGIDGEIQKAKQGLESGLFFKTNSITDKDIINKLVEASQAGVHVKLLVRGISCIVPGIKGYTENIEVVSIVGRLLEHSRIYGFGVGINAKIYLSSADLMTRNMEKRVEVAWPLHDLNMRKKVLDYLDICFSDTAKLRALRSNGTYTPLGYFIKHGDNNLPSGFSSQIYHIKQAHKNSTDAEAIEWLAAKEAAAEASKKATHKEDAEAARKLDAQAKESRRALHTPAQTTNTDSIDANNRIQLATSAKQKGFFFRLKRFFSRKN